MKSYAVYSVLNDDFVEGYAVMLHSFLKHNSGYAVDAIIAYNDKVCPLSSKNRAWLQTLFSDKIQLIFRAVPEGPYRQVFKVIPKVSARLRPALLLFDVFKISSYDKILCIDADIVVVKSLRTLFESNSEVQLFKDADYFNTFKTGVVNLSTYRPSPFKRFQRKYVDSKRNFLVQRKGFLVFLAKVWFSLVDFILRIPPCERDTFTYFSTGFFLLGKQYRTTKIFQSLITFCKSYTGVPFLADQDLLNDFAVRKFHDVSYMPSVWNGPKVKYPDALFHKYAEDKPLFIHYVGKKPWSSQQESDVFHSILPFWLPSGRKITLGYTVRESYVKINSLWEKYRVELL